MTEAILKAFRDLSIAELTNAIRSDPEMERRFSDLPLSKRREIEREIERRAELIAGSMLKRLERHGFLESDLEPEVVVRLYEQALKENEAL